MEENTTDKGITILIAEDEESNFLLLKTILKKHCNVLHAKTGKELLEIYKKEHADLILMDIQMPIMNGYEAAAKIRRIDDRKKADIPIIALTANAFSEDKDNAIKAGMNDHVPKPIDMNVLLPAMQKLITGK